MSEFVVLLVGVVDAPLGELLVDDDDELDDEELRVVADELVDDDDDDDESGKDGATSAVRTDSAHWSIFSNI